MPDFTYERQLTLEEQKVLYRNLLLSDQQFRDEHQHYLRSSEKRDRIKESSIFKKMDQADSDNQKVLAKLVYRYGWPSQKKYGDTAALAAWNVAMHAPAEYIQPFIELVEKAAKSGENTVYDYVTLQDRVLYKQGKKQYFGAYAHCDRQQGKFIFLPMDDTSVVNTRRSQLGLAALTENTCELPLGLQTP